MYAQVDVVLSPVDLHSGGFGGAVANPAMALAEIIVALKGPDGRIRVPGFYDEVGTKYNEALADPDTVVLVAEDEDGEVVGMAYGEARTPSRFSDERALELSGVVVRAGYRGRGVGRELVHEAARFAADRGVRWVELKTFAPNRGAMEFWEDLGFTARVVQLTSPTKGLLERLEGR